MHPPASRRSTVRRLARRASYDPEVVFGILDAAFVAHVSFVHDDHPFVIPMVYVRRGEELMLHGAAASRLLSTSGTPMSACVTLLDGLVYARSQFHHSVNYRSVVILGVAREITDDAEKRVFLDAIVDRFSPGRTQVVRGPNPKELAATRVLALPITEASAKIRTGGPVDDPEDLELPVWAGVLPLALEPRAALPFDESAIRHPAPVHPRGVSSAG